MIHDDSGGLYADPLSNEARSRTAKGLQWPFSPDMTEVQAFLALVKWAIVYAGYQSHQHFAAAIGWPQPSMSMFLTGNRPPTWDRISTVVAAFRSLDPAVYDLVRLLGVRAYLPQQFWELPCYRDALEEAMWTFQGSFPRLVMAPSWERPAPDCL